MTGMLMDAETENKNDKRTAESRWTSYWAWCLICLALAGLILVVIGTVFPWAEASGYEKHGGIYVPWQFVLGIPLSIVLAVFVSHVSRRYLQGHPILPVLAVILAPFFGLGIAALAVYIFLIGKRHVREHSARMLQGTKLALILAVILVCLGMVALVVGIGYHQYAYPGGKLVVDYDGSRWDIIYWTTTYSLLFSAGGASAFLTGLLYLVFRNRLSDAE
jgi:hypothetical protein